MAGCMGIAKNFEVDFFNEPPLRIPRLNRVGASRPRKESVLRDRVEGAIFFGRFQPARPVCSTPRLGVGSDVLTRIGNTLYTAGPGKVRKRGSQLKKFRARTRPCESM